MVSKSHMSPPDMLFSNSIATSMVVVFCVPMLKFVQNITLKREAKYGIYQTIPHVIFDGKMWEFRVVKALDRSVNHLFLCNNRNHHIHSLQLT